MDAESGDLRPNHNLKLVFSPVRHVYHRSAFSKYFPSCNFFCVWICTYLPSIKSYIRIFQDQFLHLGNVPLLCLLPPACQQTSACVSFSVKQKFTRFPIRNLHRKFTFLCRPNQRPSSYSVSFTSYLFQSLHSLLFIK